MKISFQGNLETKNVASSYALILKALGKSYSQVVITLDDYEKCDFAFIQLLLMIKLYVENKGLDLTWKLDLLEEDAGLLAKLNILHFLETKPVSNESISS